MKKALWILVLAGLAACNTATEEEATFNVVGVWQNSLDFALCDTSIDMIQSLMAIQDSTDSFLEFMADSTGEARLFEGTAEETKAAFSWEQIGDTIRTHMDDRSFDYLITANDSMEVIALQNDPFGVRGRIIRVKTKE